MQREVDHAAGGQLWLRGELRAQIVPVPRRNCSTVSAKTSKSVLAVSIASFSARPRVELLEHSRSIDAADLSDVMVPSEDAEHGATFLPARATRHRRGRNSRCSAVEQQKIGMS